MSFVSESAYTDAPVAPTISANGDGPVTVTLVGGDDTVIRYTKDGSDPRLIETSEEYSAPIVLTHSATIKAVAIRDGQLSDVVVQSVTLANPVNVRPRQFDPYANP